MNIEDEVRSSFLAYSMSVIISRALPDARDGLKPSQRRLLYAMHWPFRQYESARDQRLSPIHDRLDAAGAVFGEVADYTVCPGLHAMKTFARLIPGLTYDGPLSELHGLEAHAFSGERGVVHALWTIDGRGAELESLYSPEDLVAAEWIDRDGATLDEPPGLITESPVYATWPTGRAIKAKNAARTIPRLTIHEPTHVYREDEWRGAVVAASAAERDRLLAVIGPTVVKDAARRETLREARNTVWRIDDPLNPGESLVVKRWLLKPLHKRVD